MIYTSDGLSTTYLDYRKKAVYKPTKVRMNHLPYKPTKNTEQLHNNDVKVTKFHPNNVFFGWLTLT